MLKRVLNARVSDVLSHPTPLEEAPLLSEKLDMPVFLKREDLTPVFSFKLRGAYNRVARLSASERDLGVIAASAGNHAQGVAFACRKLGVSCQIVMPETTPMIKVQAVNRFGADVLLRGDSYSDAAAYAAEMVREHGRLLIHPFDDLEVIAGQGTIALELLQQMPPEVDLVMLPVGGGGLAAGVASVLKEVRPHVRVLGVEPEDSNAMQLSLAAGKPVELERVGIFADGVAVRRVGDHTFGLCQQYLDGVVTVSVDEICAAIRDGFHETRTMLEPAGALALAGLKRVRDGRAAVSSTGAVCVLSGANVAFSRFGYIGERAEVGEDREAILAVTIPERRGEFLDFCRVIGEVGITEFNYRLSSREFAQIFVGLETGSSPASHRIINALRGRGYTVVDLSQDEVAKTHIRHMVGGRSSLVENEVLFDFEFPERPGAALEFLLSLSDRWNVSLFHYRNHGAAFGRVLCGMEVPCAQREEVKLTLDELGFSYRNVSDSPSVPFITGI